MDLYTPPSVAYGGAYAIRPYDRVRAALQKTILFSSPSGPSVRRMQYAPMAGYVRSFEILMQHPQPDTRDPTKYRYDLSTGGEGAFGMWGDGGYRLRGRRV